MIIIRAPKIFQQAWNTVIKHFFSKESREKMLFPGDDDYLKVLAKYIDLSILPSCINPQGKGRTAIGMPKRLEGGKIPSHVGMGGEGYVAKDSGISQACTGPSKGTSSVCETLTKSDSIEKGSMEVSIGGEITAACSF